MSNLKRFKVTITEILSLTIEIEAENQQDAEQRISDDWKNGKYILSSDDFIDVEFQANILYKQND